MVILFKCFSLVHVWLLKAHRNTEVQTNFPSIREVKNENDIIGMYVLMSEIDKE